MQTNHRHSVCSSGLSATMQKASPLYFDARTNQIMLDGLFEAEKICRV